MRARAHIILKSASNKEEQTLCKTFARARVWNRPRLHSLRRAVAFHSFLHLHENAIFQI